MENLTSMLGEHESEAWAGRNLLRAGVRERSEGVFGCSKNADLTHAVGVEVAVKLRRGLVDVAENIDAGVELESVLRNHGIVEQVGVDVITLVDRGLHSEILPGFRGLVDIAVALRHLRNIHAQRKFQTTPVDYGGLASGSGDGLGVYAAGQLDVLHEESACDVELLIIHKVDGLGDGSRYFAL